ncbi:hypothetical protein Xen7305DRAFT_00000030 [Xenococcus sp. PCC 7305]|uniref:hypothetical protein n=1 Tax=Xenococcus sp. PCC 7305 TaxID=102125 RepID=UPI0002AC0A4A|nr:hypothetical protein [Xenococcus sp. PCC 7305]ELS00303.1 hypothetical protein Xen7305DRAFT_00000030 [Xenococcus sp. PCC 7305]
MFDPLFWLEISLCLFVISLIAVLIATLPTIQQLTNTARSAEKLLDTLNKELPATLEAVRLTGNELNQLTEEIDQGIGSATKIVKQVDRTITTTKEQVQQAQTGTRKVFVGFKAAWKTWRTNNSDQ